MKMNETLRFSWGHIIAFIAIIITGYLSFMGTVYLVGGRYFGMSIIVALIICTLLILMFLGLQWLKATPRNFAKRIVSERILLFSSPLIFICLLIPYFHFWNVRARGDEIVGNFRNAVSSTRVIFEEYTSYANDRINSYDHLLDSIVTAGDPGDLTALDIPKDRARNRKEAMVKTLRLQLLPEKYDSLQASALRWIDKADESASIWNIYLMGNTGQIKEAVEKWDKSLNLISEPTLVSEVYKEINSVQPFNSRVGPVAIEALDKIGPEYSSFKWRPDIWALILLPLLYFFMLLPYLLQERFSKSLEGIVAKKKDNETTGPSTTDDGPDEYGSFTIKMDSDDD